MENRLILGLKGEDKEERIDIKNVLRIVEGYYKQTFDQREVSQHAKNLFLGNVESSV